MGLSIFAIKSGDVIFSFDTHDDETLAKDAEEIANRGEDPFNPNPKYIEGADFSMSEGNFIQLLSAIGLEPSTRSLDPQMVLEACDEYLALKASIEMEDYMGRRAMQLYKVAKVAINNGADAIIAA